MSERTKLFWLGVFIILTLCVLGWLLLLLRPSYGDAGKEIRVRFANVEGISPGTQVVFAGKPVGEVVKIIPVPDARNEPPAPDGDLYFYELILRVDSSVDIYSYDKISYATTGLLGEKSISIIPRAAPPGSPPAQNITDTTIYAYSTDRLQETLSELLEIGREIESAIGELGDFVQENKEELTATIQSLHATSDEFGWLLHKTNEIELVCTLQETAFQATQTLNTANQLFHQILDKNLIATLSHSLNDLSQITGNINAGQGSLGQLLQSDCLYYQLTTTLSRLDTLICDISNYCLLFQYNRKWQRLRACRISQQLSAEAETLLMCP